MPFFLLFLIFPLAEFMVFAMLSAKIGFLTCVCLCFLSAILGGALIQQQGLRRFQDMRAVLNGDPLPMDDLFDSLCALIAGVLLIIPGFITDIFAIILLIPKTRKGLHHAMGRHRSQNTDIIEGEFERIDPDKKALGGDKFE
jgi:UPF0716 protein FxsA